MDLFAPPMEEKTYLFTSQSKCENVTIVFKILYRDFLLRFNYIIFIILYYFFLVLRVNMCQWRGMR